MFTLEVGGTPVAVADADEAEARALFLSADFQEDLREMTSGGEPLWDGEEPLTVRAATEKEVAELNEPDLDEMDDDDEDGEGTLVTFLVDIDFDEDDEDDIDDEDDDEEEDGEQDGEQDR